MNITQEEKCCGCALCVDVCPSGCVSMDYDKYGFYKPILDSTKCIACKRCVRMCPANRDVEGAAIQQVYKGHAKNIASVENQKSTSGAIFGVLAENIIDSNGVVFGVAFNDDFKNVAHTACYDMLEVNSCRGSKYIQSQTQGIYRKVDEKLRQGKKVLFSGTPCQVAALKSFLNFVPDNLYTVDFVCHGVGSTRFYQENLNKITQNKQISYVGFRDKCGLYFKSKFRVMDLDGNLLADHLSYDKNFGKAFANNLISRESCGTCKYATAKRVSDISLADNIIFVSEEEKKHGSSFVFINTQKGFDMFFKKQENVVVEKLDNDKVIPRIMHLNHPAYPHKDRKRVLKALSEGKYEKAESYISHYQSKRSLTTRIKKKLKICYRHIKKYTIVYKAYNIFKCK